MLGVDSVVNNNVVGSESGSPMGEGPGKGGAADLTDIAEGSDDSEGAREELITDGGSEVSLAITIVDIDGVRSMVDGISVCRRNHRSRAQQLSEYGRSRHRDKGSRLNRRHPLVISAGLVRMLEP